jgi:hypothetical protein
MIGRAVDGQNGVMRNVRVSSAAAATIVVTSLNSHGRCRVHVSVEPSRQKRLVLPVETYR